LSLKLLYVDGRPYTVCGSVLEEDMVVRLRKVQVLVDGGEETAIMCYWVTDGIDRC